MYDNFYKVPLILKYGIITDVKVAAPVIVDGTDVPDIEKYLAV